MRACGGVLQLGQSAQVAGMQALLGYLLLAAQDINAAGLFGLVLVDVVQRGAAGQHTGEDTEQGQLAHIGVGDGLVDKNGKNLELDFYYYAGRAELPIFAEATQADAKKIGIKVNLKQVDYNILDSIGKKGAYDLWITNILTLQAGDPEVYLNMYWKSNKNGSNPTNGSGYSNPKFDALSDQLAAEFDPAKRKALVIEMEKLIMADSCGVVFGYPQTNMISNKTVTGAKMRSCDFYWITNEMAPAK